ncbi:MAG TPA: PEGA domain-containing protein, partial [Armatimonadetes bacterium]|nr:PEGA domain-containing protein [Armatimonadota bacterium]
MQDRDMTVKTKDNRPVRIEPVPLRESAPRHEPPRAFFRWLTAGILLAVFMLLVSATWFVFTARQLIINIHPAPQKVAISGSLPAVMVGNYYLIHPGTYVLEAHRPCYRTLKEQLSVSGEKRQKVVFRLQPLPGHITFDIRPADDSGVGIQGLQLLIDDGRWDPPSNAEATLPPGKRQVEIRSENYQPLTTSVEVEGCDRRQTFRFRLKPDWARVGLDSVPSGTVWIDGRQAGRTPFGAPLKSGSHRLEIRAPGFQT